MTCVVWRSPSHCDTLGCLLCPDPDQLPASTASDWSRRITWPEHWPLIGQNWSRDPASGRQSHTHRAEAAQSARHHTGRKGLLTSLHANYVNKIKCFRLYHSNHNALIDCLMITSRVLKDCFKTAQRLLKDCSWTAQRLLIDQLKSAFKEDAWRPILELCQNDKDWVTLTSLPSTDRHYLPLLELLELIKFIC